jgi:hypothetical protein
LLPVPVTMVVKRYPLVIFHDSAQVPLLSTADAVLTKDSLRADLSQFACPCRYANLGVVIIYVACAVQIDACPACSMPHARSAPL